MLNQAIWLGASYVPNPEKKPDGAASDAILAKLANETWDDGAWVTDGGGGTAGSSFMTR